MEMSRIYGQMLRAQRKALNLSEESVAKSLGIKRYVVTSVELCLSITPGLWKTHASNMLRLYGVTLEQLPRVTVTPEISSQNKFINEVEKLVKLVDVGYDIYSLSSCRAVVDFIGFTTMTDMHEAIDIMRRARPGLKAKIYNERLVIVSFT